MEKLQIIDEFMKFFPKINLDADLESSDKIKSNLLNENNKNYKNSLSISELNSKVKEKIKNYNTNARKNNKIKKQRKSKPITKANENKVNKNKQNNISNGK